MQNGSDDKIPRILMDTSVLPEAEQFAHWAAHTRGTRLSQPEPGHFFCRGDLWNLGELQITLVDVDPFIAIRDQAIVNAADSDHIQFVQLIEGEMTIELSGVRAELNAPASFVRDASKPSYAKAGRTRFLILYFARSFIEEATGLLNFQGFLSPTPELAFLTRVAIDMLEFFPSATASNAPLYATILRDLAANSIRRAANGHRDGRPPLLVAAKAYIAAQPPGTLSVSAASSALNISRSALYRMFEREGGILAYDRLRRLRALHRAMCNPLNTSSLAELGERYGFSDPTSLSRSFRKAFGLSPSELRQRHAHPAPTKTKTASHEIQDVFDRME